jgi:ssDNA-binding protein
MADRKLIIGPEVIASYPHVFTPYLRKGADPGTKPMFSIVSLFTHAALLTPEYKALVDGVTECGIATWGKAKFEEMLREGTLGDRTPFKKDISSKGYDPARFAVRVESSQLPDKVVHVLDNRIRTSEGKPSPIVDQREIYPGVIFRGSYSPRAYGGPGTSYKAGLSLDLRNVLKMGDGERLVAAGPNGDEFGGIAAPPASDGAIDSASLASLLG